jgi:phage baseplate assembly protein W
MAQFFTGYSGLVWQTVYQTLAFYTEQLEILLNNSTSTTNSAAIVQLSEGMLSTLLNAAQAINADALASAWEAEFTNLEAIQALPLILDQPTTDIFNNRVAAYGSALPTLVGMIPQPPFNAPSVVSQGLSSIPYINLLDLFSTFDVETPPPGLSPDSFTATALSIAIAMQNVANAISLYQGRNITQLYDVAQRESFAAAFAANIIASFTSGPIAGVPGDEGIGSSAIGEFIIGISPIAGALQPQWNQIATLPAMTIVGAILSSAPYLFANQQQAVIRNTMLTFASQIEVLLLTLRQPNFTQVNLTTLRVNETLLDVAARTTGNFEDWVQIANLNGLAPPYVGPNNAPGIAGWGSQLVLPTPGAQNAAIGTPPSYPNNFLGIDIYIGPINGVMPAWQGDFENIAGYANLSWALGRRIQTTQGTLMYHPNYGSRIPPQVGALQTNETAGHIAAYGKSALLSDPRVAQVPIATGQLQANGKIAFYASVQPSGFQNVGVPVNETISPLP